MSSFPDDVSENIGRDTPINTGESTVDIVLNGIDSLGSNTRFIKHWHIAPLQEDELAEMVITFMDLSDGTIDTAV